ncbi:MAG: putative permease [Sphingomonadales bacterium]|nr:putative permease [Sphingomonadales bacterium]
MKSLPKIEDRVFGAMVIVVSLGFAIILWPFFGAVLWALVATILFEPLNRRLLARMPARRNLASAITLVAVVGLVVVPAMILGALLLQEASGLYVRLQSGQIDFPAYFASAQSALPHWVNKLLERVGLTDFQAAQQKIGAGIANSIETLTARAVNIGQSAFGFLIALSVMLYLTFFFMRDATELSALVDRAVPLRAEQRQALAARFIAVVRATIQGSLIVAILQGAIGGVLFWLLGVQGAVLWGVAMAFFSLLPAIGTGLVWVPVAAYLLLTGSIWQGAVLVFCGLFVIGMVDNVLRPILVGRTTRIPDYIVLISTLGGIEVFGFNGFVIGPVIAALFISVWEIFTASRMAESPVA